jgi:hypothetical protein
MSQFAAPGPVQFDGASVCVVGARVVGLSAAAILHSRGAKVLLVDRYDDEVTTARAADVAARGVTLRLGDDATLPEGVDLVVVSPGIPPTAPIVRAAAERGVPVWGDAELAWRLRAPLPDGSYAPWLAVTGTNGKSTTVRMAEAMLQEAGRNAVARGPAGPVRRPGRRPLRGPGHRAVELPAALAVLDERAGRRGPQPGAGPHRLARRLRRVHDCQGPHLRELPDRGGLQRR